MLKQMPPQYKTYIEEAHKLIKERKILTHQDIKRLIPECNCSYSVIQGLRKKCNMLENWTTEGKRHKIYIYVGEFDDDE
jgi:uncharacterized protein YpmB